MFINKINLIKFDILNKVLHIQEKKKTSNKQDTESYKFHKTFDTFSSY